MTSLTRLTIDKNAFVHNLSRVKDYAKSSKVIAVLKANAYGHGLVSTAKALDTVDKFGVAFVEEALTLRDSGVTKPIVVLQGVFSESELMHCAKSNIEIVVHHTEQLKVLEHTKVNAPIAIWIKIDTGMHRLGFLPDEFESVYKRVLALGDKISQVQLMTHFASADVVDNTDTKAQIKSFDELTKNLKLERSMANSAAIMAWPDSHTDFVRPGIMLYGISPFENKSGHDYNLKPVMQLHSILETIRECKKGDKLGYNGTYLCPRDMRVGIVPVGYGDGYPRRTGGGGPIVVNKKLTSILGRVSMDMLCVNLNDIPNAKIGDEVELIGPNVSVEAISEYAGLYPYELICRISERYQYTI